MYRCNKILEIIKSLQSTENIFLTNVTNLYGQYPFYQLMTVLPEYEIANIHLFQIDLIIPHQLNPAMHRVAQMHKSKLIFRWDSAAKAVEAITTRGAPEEKVAAAPRMLFLARPLAPLSLLSRL